jgi:hypothetical protein
MANVEIQACLTAAAINLKRLAASLRRVLAALEALVSPSIAFSRNYRRSQLLPGAWRTDGEYRRVAYFCRGLFNSPTLTV